MIISITKVTLWSALFLTLACASPVTDSAPDNGQVATTIDSVRVQENDGLEWDLKFGTQDYIDGTQTLGKFRIQANAMVVILERYDPNSDEAKLIQSSEMPVKSTSTNSDSTEFIFVTSEYLFTIFLNEKLEYECTKAYDDGVIGEHYYNKKNFNVRESVPDRNFEGPCLILRNADIDYLIKGDNNEIKFHAYGNKTKDIRLETDNGRVVSRYGRADVFVDNNLPTTLSMYIKGDSVPLYSKTFRVIEQGQKTPIQNDLHIDDACASILRTNATRLFAGEVNNVLVTLGGHYAKATEITVKGGDLISFSKGVLKIKPHDVPVVKISFTDKPNGDLSMSSEFLVVER
jgi:hypothetical protein